MNKKKRIVMLGVLCAGLLLIGIGAGVVGLEFSEFTYSGNVIPEEEPVRKVETFRVDSKDAQIWIQSDLWYPNLTLDAVTEIKVSEDMTPGTVQVAVSSRQMPGMEIWMSAVTTQGNTCINLMQHTVGEMAKLFSYKDQLLEDLKNRELHEYVSLYVDAVEITVNPADKERIHLFDGPAPAVECYAYDTDSAPLTATVVDVMPVSVEVSDAAQ